MHQGRSTRLIDSSFFRHPARLYISVFIVLVAITAAWPLLESLSFADRTIGAFALADVNVNTRNVLYMLGIGIAFCLLSLVFWRSDTPVFSRLRYRSLASSRTSPAFLVYTLILTNAVLYIYFRAPVYLAAAQLLILLCAAHIALSRVLAPASTLAERVWILGLSYQLAVSLQLLATEHTGLDGVFIAGFAIFVVMLSYGFRTSPTMIHWAYPVVWLPLVPILASELDYLLLRRFDHEADFHTTCAALSALFLLWSAYRWRRVSAGAIAPGTAPSYVFSRYLLPIVITSRALAEYSPAAVLRGSSYDFFHLGEMVLTVHQTTRFGAIPYIDYYPPHGLFDFLPQAIYSLIYGSQILETLAWGHGYMTGWFPRLVAGAIFFVFFSRFWGRLPTALIMLFLPTYHLLHPYYSFLLIPALFIHRLPAVPSRFVPWLHLWLAVLALGIWRVDFAIAAGVGCMGVLFVSAWQQQSWRIVLAGVTSATLVGLVLLVSFAVVALLRDHSPLSLLVQAFQYVRNQIPVTSYTDFIREIDVTAVVQLVGLPLLSVLALVFAGNKSVFLLRPLNHLERILLYLALISLIMSFRSLHRHSLYVGYFNAYLFVFVGLALFCYLPRKHFKSAMCLTIAAIAITHVFLPRSSSVIHQVFYGYETDKQYLLAAREGEFLRWNRNTEDPGARLDDTVKDRRDEIVRFLRQNLSEDQTYYDFTNSPLLYALADRKAPNYLFETLYHSSDTTQHHVIKELEQLRDQQRLPFVLFRYSGEGSMENVDGVNTVLRSYRVAEYIYRNYQPCVRIGSYDVWVEQQSQSGQSCSSLVFDNTASGAQSSDLANAPFDQHIDAGFIPLIWAQRDPYCALCQPLLQRWEFPAETARMWSLDLAANSSGRAAFLELVVTAKQDAIVEARYGNSHISMNVRATDQPQAYVVRLSVLHAWWRDSLPEIRISSDKPIILNSAALREGD